ncbi:hypothetical protein ASC93_10910 [Massilia sp. Root335]|nr:hypothetical protein ASC93_10910 [Massilia sp. Root335]
MTFDLCSFFCVFNHLPAHFHCFFLCFSRLSYNLFVSQATSFHSSSHLFKGFFFHFFSFKTRFFCFFYISLTNRLSMI